MYKFGIVGALLCASAAVAATSCGSAGTPGEGQADAGVQSSGSEPGLALAAEVSLTAADIQSALDALAESGGGLYRLPRGNHNLGSVGIVVPPGVSFRGDDSFSTTLSYAGSGTAVAIDSGEGVTSRHRGFIHGYFAVEQVGGSQQGKGIWLRSCTRCTIEGVTVKGFDRGIDTSGKSWSSVIRSSWVVLNHYGIYLGATDDNFVEVGNDRTKATATGFNGGTISNCEIQANGVGVYGRDYGWGASAYVAHGAAINNNVIEGNLGPGIVVSSQNGGTSIRENYFEKNCKSTCSIDPATDDISLSRGDIGEFLAADIVQNMATKDYGMRGPVISANHFVDGNGHSIYLDRSATAVVENNMSHRSFVARQREGVWTDSGTGFLLTGNRFWKGYILSEAHVGTVKAFGNRGQGAPN